MMFLKDLYATIVIFISNFSASYGHTFNALVFTLITALVLVLVVRTILAGRTFHRHRPLSTPDVDPDVCASAAEALAEAVRFPTVSGNKQALDDLVSFLKRRYAAAFGRMKVMHLPDGSLLLRLGAPDRKGAHAPVLFCGHLDVVPPGEGWNRDPFGGERDGGVIHGRGTADCKGTVIALLEAISSLLEEGYVPSRDIYFAFGSDEETGGLHGARACADILTKRGISFEMILDEGGYIGKSHMGRRSFPAARLGVGEKALCQYRLTATSDAPGQIGAPPKHTAVGVLAEAICRIEASQKRVRLVSPVTKTLKASMPAMGFSRRLVVGNLQLTRPFVGLCFRGDSQMMALLHSTLSPNCISGSPSPALLPATAQATISACLLQGDTAVQVKRQLTGLLADLPINVELLDGYSDPSPISSTDEPLYQSLGASIEIGSAHV